jgi:PPM family protein phosphatase
MHRRRPELLRRRIPSARAGLPVKVDATAALSAHKAPPAADGAVCTVEVLLDHDHDGPPPIAAEVTSLTRSRLDDDGRYVGSPSGWCIVTALSGEARASDPDPDCSAVPPPSPPGRIRRVCAARAGLRTVGAMGAAQIFHGDDLDVRSGPFRLVSRRHRRGTQQDAAAAAPHLVAVADGMGGHADGADAALAAVSALAGTVTGPCDLEGLVAGFAAAQTEVASLGEPGGYRNPGSTLVAVVADPDGAHVHGAWIGDSRIYGVAADGVVALLTEDHAGFYGGLLAALGEHGPEFWQVGTFTVPATEFGWLLLTSDGFHGPLEAAGVLGPDALLGDPGDLARLAALAAAGSDNITVLAAAPSQLR